MSSIPVNTTTLDRLWRFSGRVPDLIKVDVEGAEDALLEGAKPILEPDRPRLAVEIHPPHGGRAIRLLRSHGYGVTDLAGTPLEWKEVASQAAERSRGPFHLAFLPIEVLTEKC